MTIHQKKTDLQNIKQFFKYLFENKITMINYSVYVPSVRVSKKAHLL